MAEVKDQETRVQPAPNPETIQTAQKKQEKTGLKQRWTQMPRKKRRNIVRGIIALVILLAAILLIPRFFGEKQTDTQVITSTVEYGSITSQVKNSGLTRAKNSETISINTPGTMMEILVEEGQKVTAGTPLFVVDSPAAQSAVDKARSTLEGYEKQLNTLRKDIAGLNLAAGYPGKLMETIELNPGDAISKGQKVATLADDTQLRLEQYYSYAYAGDLKAGQKVQVSIPALMTSLTGTVEAVHMVSRITPEGSKLFSAEILIKNPGSLTAEMAATATAVVNGETVYPYEQGQLEYYRVGDLCSTVSGTVIDSHLVDYLQVKQGQVLVHIDGEESEGELFAMEESVETARKDLEKAQKNLSNCNAVAPIDGTVIGLMTLVGDEISTDSPICTISDTSVITINADVDERHVSMIKPGDMVELNQWDTMAMGVVESVSLSSTLNNGVARYPMVISAENADGILQVNSYITYTVTAAENDNCLILPLQCVRTVSLEDGTPVTAVYVAGSKPDNVLEGVMPDETIPEGYWPVQVETGISDNSNVEIKSGVEQGTEVFTQVQTMEVWG